MLAQNVGVTPKAAPAGNHFVRRLIGLGQLLQLCRQRLEAGRGRLREHPTPFAILERAAAILEPAVQRRGVVGRHRRQCVPAHLELCDVVDGGRPRKRLDLLADRDAIGLLARQRVRPLALGFPFLLPLCDRLPHGIAGRFELLGENGVDLDVGLEVGPGESHRGQRRRRLVRIADRDERFGPMQEVDGTLAIRGRHLRRRLVTNGLCRLLEQANPGPRATRGHFVAGTLRDRGEARWIGDPFERGDRGVRVLRFQGNVRDLVRVGHPRERAKARGSVLRVSAHGPERFLVCKQIDDRRAHAGAGAVAGHEDDLLGPAEGQERLDCVDRLVDFVGLGGHPGESTHGFGAYLLVRVRSGDLAEHGDRVYARDRGAAHPGFRVLARKYVQGVGLIRTELVDRGGAHRGVGVFPAGLRKKFFENAHAVSAMAILPGTA